MPVDTSDVRKTDCLQSKNGPPDFKREVSLVGIDEQQVKAIEEALRSGDETSVSSQFNFPGSQNIGAPWTRYCIAAELGIITDAVESELSTGEVRTRYKSLSQVE